MRRRGHTRSEIQAAISETNKRCEHPLPGEEVRHIIGSAMKYEPTQSDGRGDRAAAPAGSGQSRLAATPVDLHARKRRHAGPRPAIIAEGQRNVRLMSVAGTMRHANMSRDDIEAALLRLNARRCKPPLPVDKVRAIAASVMRYPDDGEHNRTDSGNAERLIEAYGDRIRYCALWGSWLVWDGRRWAKDDVLAIEHLAGRALRLIHIEAAVADGEAAENLGVWALKSESAQRRRAAIECARSDPRIAVRPEQLDNDLWLFNCLNGTIDLHTGELREHRREDLITKLAPVEFDPDATLELWDRVLDEATEGNKEMVAFLARLAGYSLTGDTGEEKLPFVYGPAATSKSTVLEAFKAPGRLRLHGRL